MSPRLRRRLTRASALTGCCAAVAAAAMVFAFNQKPASTVFNVVAVEARSTGAATVEADIAAEMSQVQANGGTLLVSSISDVTAAPALYTNLSCPADDDPISCSELQQHQATEAEEVADGLVTSPRPAQIDIYALFEQVAGYLAQNPSEKHSAIELFVNTLGDADIPQDLVAANLADQATVAGLISKAVAEGAFPGPGGCSGFAVHMVVPATSDAGWNLGEENLFRALLAQCGGHLASWTARWIAPGNSALALPPIPDVVAPSPAQVAPTYRIPDTFFGVGSAQITASGESVLAQVATALLVRYSRTPFTCVGTADGTGGSSPAVLRFDLSISRARAEAVCNQLVLDGVPAGLAGFKGLGQTTRQPDPSQRAVAIVIGKGTTD